MPQAQPKGLHIDRWLSGLFTNRAATSTPFRYSYGRPIMFHDALIDGSNMEITPANTLARRPGYPQFNASNALSGGETALGFFSAILGGILYDFLDTTVNVYLFTSSTLTSIWTKTTTAQSRFAQVGNAVFWSDGTVNKKVTIDTQGNVVVSNSGLVAPIAAPTIPSLNLYNASSQTTHAWVPGYSYANTTGSPQQFYLLAPTGEIFWSIVPAGTTRQSGTTPPAWSSVYQSFGSVVSDGGMTWTNCGAPASWVATHAYTKTAFSANNTPFSVLNTTQSVTTGGSAGSFQNWQAAGLAYGAAQASGHTGTTNLLQISGLGFSIPTSATVTGVKITINKACNRSNSVKDVTVQLLKAGVGAGSNKAATGFWAQTVSNFYNIPQSGGVKVQYGSNTDLWGTSIAPADVNNAGFGIQIEAQQTSSSTTSFAITPDTSNNNVLADVTVYYTVGSAGLTGTAFQSIVTDSNGNLQACTATGTSGGSAPSWATTVGGTTAGDGSTSWVMIGTGGVLSAQFSWTYGYCYQGNVGVFHTSTMSPTLTVQAPILGFNVSLQGVDSADTQVDTCMLYRTVDGGGLFLQDIPSPNDSTLSTAPTWADTNLDSSLNPLIVAPVAHANDPPLVGNTVMAYWMGRMWALNGNLLYFSAGPDCTNGDGAQAWPPANVFTLTAAGSSLKATSQGLVVVLPNEIDVVLGGPQALTFWVQPLIKGYGALNDNAVTQEADEVVIYTAQSQVFAISPNGKNELGVNVAPTLAANFNPNTSYLTIHRNGQDQGLFISDGSSKVMRYNMNAECWDPIATPVGGIGPIASIDTALGTRTLVSVIGTHIVGRSTTTFADAGSAYAAFATIGSIVMSEPGEAPVMVESILLTSASVGTALAVSVMPNEISGSFSSLPTAVNDPPMLPAFSTINMKKYYWKYVAAQLPQMVKHLQVKITLPASDTVKNEIYTLGILQ